MTPPEHARRLRIFTGEAQTRKGRPLYELIVEEARRQGLAGATVQRGIMGYGASSRVHSAKILRLSEDLPVVVELVDSDTKIDAFLPFLDDLLDKGMVTVEPVQMLFYRGPKKD